LTALDVDPEYFHADLAQETLDRTSLGALAAGARVNLELPTAAGSPLGGHVVQGHVDGTGTLAALDPVVPRDDPRFNRKTTDWTLKVRVPEEVRPWMVHKGSVSIEGISLTIAGFDGETISIAILPLTYWRTNLHTLGVGAPVNVEADVLVKLAWERMRRLPGPNTRTSTPRTETYPWGPRTWGTHSDPEFELTESWLVANGY
jgi:riboflavin synthase